MSDRDRGKILEFKVGFGDTAVAEARPVDEELTPPLRVLFVGELLPSDAFRASAGAPRRPHAADRGAFDDFMAGLRPIVAFEVADPFDGAQPKVEISLTLDGMRALRPDAWLETVAPIRALAEARRIVEQVRAGAMPLASLGRELARVLPRRAWADALTRAVPAASTKPAATAAAPTPTSATPMGGGLDDLLASVDLPGASMPQEEPARDASTSPSGGRPTSAAAPRTPFSSLITAFAKGRGETPTREGEPSVDVVAEQLDAGLGRLVDGILGHPELRRLERVWRDLRFLSQHARDGVRLEAIASDRANLAATIEHGLATPADVPVDLVVVDERFGATAHDAQLLAELAALAERTRTPVLVDGLPSLLGCERIETLGRSGGLLATADEPSTLQVRRVANDESSRWLVVTMNAPLLRAAHDAQSARLRGMQFQESEGASRHLFGSGAAVVAALLADAQVRTGWPGVARDGRESIVVDLPVHALEGDEGYAIPLEALVSRDLQAEAARAGVVLLACARNHDAAVIGRVSTFHRSGAPGGARSVARSTLQDQLFAGRAYRAAALIVRALEGEVDEATILAVAQAALERALGSDGRRPLLDLRFDRASRALDLRIRPGGIHGVELDEIGVTLRLD